MESDIEQTPGPLRAALDRAMKRRESGHVIAADTTVTARFTTREWVAIIVGVLTLTTYTYGQFKDIKHELTRLQSQRDLDRAANAELAASLREFSKSVYDLQMAVLRLEAKAHAQ